MLKLCWRWAGAGSKWMEEARNNARVGVRAAWSLQEMLELYTQDRGRHGVAARAITRARSCGGCWS